MTIRSMPGNDNYRSNHDRIFGEKPIKLAPKEDFCLHKDTHEEPINDHERVTVGRFCIQCGERIE